MIDLRELSPGMKVVIVNEWCDGCYQNPHGEMDKYLGTVVTVREVYYDHISIEEDIDEYEDGWSWFAPAIDRVYEGCMGSDFDVADADSIIELIFGGDEQLYD